MCWWCLSSRIASNWAVVTYLLHHYHSFSHMACILSCGQFWISAAELTHKGFIQTHLGFQLSYFVILIRQLGKQGWRKIVGQSRRKCWKQVPAKCIIKVSTCGSKQNGGKLSPSNK